MMDDCYAEFHPDDGPAELPFRCCNYYDPETHDMCTTRATHIVSHDDGEPGMNGVLSSYRCASHLDDCTVRNHVDYASWYAKYILNITPQDTDWDLL